MVQRDNRSEIHKFIHNISRDGVDMDLRIQYNAYILRNYRLPGP